jgi:tetratricopeptide (TPR) repeat protein
VTSLTDFGAAIRKARTAQGMTLELLAHEALGNADRKSYVSAVEKGKKKLSPLTIQKFAKALDLPDSLVDPLLGAAPPQDDPQSDIDAATERLLRETKLLRDQIDLSEDWALSIARRYAEGNPTNLADALRGIERAFELASEKQHEVIAPNNIDAAIDEIIKRVKVLNQQGEAEAARQALIDEMQRAEAAKRRLNREGLAQAITMRDVGWAASLEWEQVMAEHPEDRFEVLQLVQHGWYERGRDKGLAFDLEVAITLARISCDEASTEDEHGAALNDLGSAQTTLGDRESSTERLEQAVAAFENALLERTRERAPLQWAMTQMNLGSALATLGARESDTEQLEQAVTAFENALLERTRERVPLDWTTTQMNLGAALQTLGKRESGTERLEQAVTAFENALLERTRERVPLQWAMTQMNLGTALQTLGERESGTERLVQAFTAYENALLERTRERVPLDWAMVQSNLCSVELAFYDKVKDKAHLQRASEHLAQAREVFEEAKASQYLKMADELAQAIADRKAVLEVGDA